MSTLISQSKSPQRQDIACAEFYVISNHKALRGIYYLLLAFFLATHFKSHAVNLKITDTTIALTLCNFLKKCTAIVQNELFSPKFKHKLVIMIYATQNILYFKILISDRSHTHSRLMTDLGLNIWHGFCTCCYKLLYFCTLLLQMCDIITNFTHRKKSINSSL